MTHYYLDTPKLITGPLNGSARGADDEYNGPLIATGQPSVNIQHVNGIRRDHVGPDGLVSTRRGSGDTGDCLSLQNCNHSNTYTSTLAGGADECLGITSYDKPGTGVHYVSQCILGPGSGRWALDDKGRPGPGYGMLISSVEKVTISRSLTVHSGWNDYRQPVTDSNLDLFDGASLVADPRACVTLIKNKRDPGPKILSVYSWTWLYLVEYDGPVIVVRDGDWKINLTNARVIDPRGERTTGLVHQRDVPNPQDYERRPLHRIVAEAGADGATTDMIRDSFITRTPVVL